MDDAWMGGWMDEVLHLGCWRKGSQRLFAIPETREQKAQGTPGLERDLGALGASGEGERTG